MTKQEANDIARLLIASSGLNFDGEAFRETDLSENDIQKIINSVQNVCSYEIARVERKNGLKNIDISTTENIVNAILYE